MIRLRRKMAVIAVTAIILTILSQGTLAYKSVIGTATNVVTTGSIKLAIHEVTEAGESFPENGVVVRVGDVVSKRVSVENLCGHPFYLRMKLVYSAEDQALQGSTEECFQPNIDESMWQLVDGWYYYKGIVEPGQRTPNLFTEVKVLTPAVRSKYAGETLTMTVVAHGVQSENNPLVDGAVWTAAGWPQEDEVTA